MERLTQTSMVVDLTWLHHICCNGITNFLYMVLWLVCLGGISSWLLFHRSAGPPELRDWTEMAESYDNLKNSVSIVTQYLIVGWLIYWRRISLNEYKFYAG